MSEEKRPTPNPPPVNSDTYVNSMAQVRPPIQLPTLSNFTGYTDRRPGPPYPPRYPSPPRQQPQRNERQPLIQLPPLDPSRQQRSNALSISNLLSDSAPTPSPNRSPIPGPHHATSRLPTDSPASSFGDSPNHHTAQYPPGPSQWPSHTPLPQKLPTHSHFLDHPPRHHQLHGQAPPPYTSQPGYHPPQHLRQPPPAAPHPQFHPKPRQEPYGGSHHSSSREPSPSTSYQPSFPTPTTVQLPPLNYTLNIRQQPVAARACGFGERDRRVVDPPPILELKITDKATGAPQLDNSCILAMHCTLLNADGSDENEMAPPGQDNMSSARRLMGTIVASPYQAKDEKGVAGTFFVFPDLSCRSPGRYKLGFKLLRVDLMSMEPGKVSPSVASAVSEVFSVYTAKDFPGMRASSDLLKALRRQGLNVGVKKGSEARKGKGRRGKGDSSDEEDEDDEDGEDGHDTPERKERKSSDASAGSRSSVETSPKSGSRKKGKKRKTGVR